MTFTDPASNASKDATVKDDDAPRKLVNRPGSVFIVSLIVRCLLSAVFLGSTDAINAVTAIPLAASRTFFYLPYFPIVQNILGATAPLVNHAHFIPIGLTVKLVPCIVDSLLSVWLLQNNRFSRRYRHRSAWLYAFCPLPLILIGLQGQWDSLWILPAVTAIAMSDLLLNATKGRRMTLFLIGALLGLAVLSKPVALIIAGLLLPSFRYRESLFAWFRDVALILAGAALTVTVFFVKFAANGVAIHQNVSTALDYGGQSGQSLFGFSHLSFFSRLNTAQTTAAVDFRQLAIVYVLAITVFQLVARNPVDRMTAAAAALLISPAIGGLNPQYLFWPLIFILASGRLRLASIYAVITSCIYFLFFLLPGASYSPGVMLGTYLPLRSLRFLGLPSSAFEWLSTPAAIDVWHPLANVAVPLAMCALAVYLLLTRRLNHSIPATSPVEPLEFRPLRTIVPYAVLLVVVVVAYGMVSTHDAGAAISSISHGVDRYAFVKPIYSLHHWSIYYFWTTKHPYRFLESGSWWGTILLLGPLGIASWGLCAYRVTRRELTDDHDVGHGFVSSTDSAPVLP